MQIWAHASQVAVFGAGLLVAGLTRMVPAGAAGAAGAATAAAAMMAAYALVASSAVSPETVAPFGVVSVMVKAILLGAWCLPQGWGGGTGSIWGPYLRKNNPPQRDPLDHNGRTPTQLLAREAP